MIEAVQVIATFVSMAVLCFGIVVHGIFGIDG